MHFLNQRVHPFHQTHNPKKAKNNFYSKGSEVVSFWNIQISNCYQSTLNIKIDH